MNPLIIDHPLLQRPADRAFWTTVRWLFWLFWIYLWLPLVSIIGWFFGVSTAVDQMSTRLGYVELLRLLPYYVSIVAISGALLVGWSHFQIRRFAGRERRKALAVASVEDLASKLTLDPTALRDWQQQRRIVAFHREDGALLFAEARPHVHDKAQAVIAKAA
jgi:biofilm PGA synthesis protein PgaD